MTQCAKARVFMSGRRQQVTIPAEYRFSSEEVDVSRALKNGDLILSQSPGGWQEFFATLDENRFPDDFLADRAQGTAETREDI